MGKSLNMNYVNCALLVVILVLVIMCCMNKSKEGFEEDLSWFAVDNDVKQKLMSLTSAQRENERPPIDVIDDEDEIENHLPSLN